MSDKVSVVIIKAKSVDATTDINKMTVHLEQILTEKQKVDVKTRQSVTEATLKGSDFIIFAGWDSMSISQLFSTISFLEKEDESAKEKLIFLFDEPGASCWDSLNRLLTEGMDLGRIDSKIFKKIVDCWSYRDIMSYIDVKLRKLDVNATSGDLNAV
jgi:hypothetical protein